MIEMQTKDTLPYVSPPGRLAWGMNPLLKSWVFMWDKLYFLVIYWHFVSRSILTFPLTLNVEPPLARFLYQSIRDVHYKIMDKWISILN